MSALVSVHLGECTIILTLSLNSAKITYLNRKQSKTETCYVFFDEVARTDKNSLRYEKIKTKETQLKIFLPPLTHLAWKGLWLKNWWTIFMLKPSGG